MSSPHSSRPDGIIGQKCCLKCNQVEFIDELKNKVHQIHYQIQSNALLTDLRQSGVGRSSDSVSPPDISGPWHLGSCQLRGSKSILSKQANAAPSCTHSPSPPPNLSEQNLWALFIFVGITQFWEGTFVSLI